MCYDKRNMEQPKTNTEEIKQNTPESVPESLSMTEVDELLKENIDVYNNLNSFYKTDIFKDVDFKDKREAADKLDDRFDESAYVKAGFWQKFENFTRFGLHKKSHGLIKSERGLLDKTETDEDITGKDIEITKDNNKKEREYLESNVVDIRGDFKKEISDRMITKRFEKVDGEIVKIIESKRTEQGQIEAAGRLRDKKINEVETTGADLVKSKEQLEKHLGDKGKLENLKYLNAEGKEDLRIKMSEEEANLSNSIKDKEAELKDKLSIFKEPLEERMSQTKELLDKVSIAFDEVKEESLKLFNSSKEINSEIKIIEKSNILEETKKQVIDNLIIAKNEMDNNLLELVKRKTELEKRNNILLINKRDLSEELSKINKIGKTKKEILEEEKDQKEAKTVGENNAIEKKETKQIAEDTAEDFSFMKGQKINEKEEERKYKKSSEDVNEGDILYDLTDEEDKEDINKIIDSYLTKNAPQKKKDKGFLAGFIKNIFGSLFELKKINIPINKKRILKETDIIFKKNQKK